MNRKTIIQIAVIAVCFGAAGVVLYNGFKDSSPSVPGLNGAAVLPGDAPTGAANPLPYGDNLSGELKRVLGRDDLQYNIINYPAVSDSEVGIPVTELVKPVPLGEFQ